MPTTDPELARAAWAKALIGYREAKDRVRTPAGVEHYGLPLGSVITLDVPDVHAHVTEIAGDWTPAQTERIRAATDALQARFRVPIKRVVMDPDRAAAGKSHDTIYLPKTWGDDLFMSNREHEMSDVLVDATLEGTLAHEYGHMLDGIMNRDDPEGRAELDAYLNEELDVPQLGHRVPRHKLGGTGDAASAYAMENRYEYVAEAFADHWRNGDQASPAGRHIGTLLERRLGRASAPPPEPAPAFPLRPLVEPLTFSGQAYGKDFEVYAVEGGDGVQVYGTQIPKQVHLYVEQGLPKGKRPSEEEIHKTLSIVADLLERFPLEGASVSVDVESKNTASSYSSSATDMTRALAYVVYGGPATIHLVEKGYKFKGSGTSFVPSHKLDPIASTVAHEYGHLHMRHRPNAGPGLPKKGSPVAMFRAVTADKKMKMSKYGLTNADEAYAEAFSEWAVTHGETTNPAARAYAEAFGWT